MAVTSNTIANQAIQMMGDNQAPVTGYAPNFDGSAAGVALANLYIPCVQTVSRQFGWDFSRNIQPLVLSGNPPGATWAYEYLYPSDCIQIRQVRPTIITDKFDPIPITYTIANTLVSGVPTKVIQTNLVNAIAVYSNYPPEYTWDALFRETVVRLLSSELSIAISSRPDTARDNLSSSMQFEQLGETRGG